MILSRADLEHIGEEIYTEYCKLPNHPYRVVDRVDAEKYAAELLHLKIDYAHLSPYRSVLGLTSFSECGVQLFNNPSNDYDELYYLDGNTILIETDFQKPDANRGRHNFTVAHEASHHAINRLCRGMYDNKPMYYRKYRTEADWEEWQADVLASVVLMPRPVIEGALCTFDIQDIDTLDPLYPSYKRFCMMAKFLGVSRQALSIRLKNLGYIQYDFVSNPYLKYQVQMRG